MSKNYLVIAFTYITRPLKTKYSLFLTRHGYLHRRGWFNSLIEKKVIDKSSTPIPWLSYPSIDFLREFLLSNATIFEYGSGYSTAFYCKYYHFVAAVEHDPNWHQLIQKQLEQYKNYEYYFSEESSEYINTIERAKRLFDCIIIDGKWRNDCLIKATTFLKPGGVIVLDDAERTEYKLSIEYVKNLGFLAIPFIGMSALSFDDHNTMIFIKR